MSAISRQIVVFYPESRETEIQALRISNNILRTTTGCEKNVVNPRK